MGIAATRARALAQAGNRTGNQPMRALICGLTALLFAAKALAAGCTLPADVSTRMGRAQSWVYNWTAAQYHFSLKARDYVWNNGPGSLQGDTLNLPGDTFSSAYIAIARVPANSRAYGLATIITACDDPRGGCPLSWFQANHPNWILLKHDRATPAYESVSYTHLTLPTILRV